MKSKEIVALSDFEHVLKRPTIWVGSVEKSEEKIPVIEDGKTILKEKTISVGYYKLLHEILDNAFDEAKRLKGKMKTITIEVFTKTGRVIVTDTGNGFEKGYEINSKTGLPNVETAMSQLRAGSNFYNEDSKDNLIGTNGVGASLVNMLSEEFEIITCDGIKEYRQKWEKFESVLKNTKKCKKKGTSVDFTPRKDTFKGCEWDVEVLHSEFVFKNYLKNLDPVMRKVKFIAKIDNEELDLDVPFFEEDKSITIDSKVGQIIVWPSFSKSTRLSFINGQMCSGIHQKIIQDNLNSWIKDDRAHEFYDTFIALNLEPKDVIFGDQNKTKFASKRDQVEPILNKNFIPKLRRNFKNSDLFKHIEKKIEQRDIGKSSRKINQISKRKKVMLSDKFFPSSKSKDILFLLEGGSALGSLNQRRDPKTMATYALRGKVKNAKDIKDLTTNKEIAEIIQILGLDLKGENETKYNKIVIATDADPDGDAIAGLLINFFYKWFPYVIENGQLYRLRTPLVTAGIGSKMTRYYNMDSFKKDSEKKKLTNIRYLKGLGSLTKPDWEHVFKNLEDGLVLFEKDKETEDKLELAFGDDADKRKKWLTI
jgi:DNA topoisomerase-2